MTWLRRLMLVGLIALPACMRPEMRRGVVLPMPTMNVDEESCTEEKNSSSSAETSSEGPQERPATLPALGAEPLREGMLPPVQEGSEKTNNTSTAETNTTSNEMTKVLPDTSAPGNEQTQPEGTVPAPNLGALPPPRPQTQPVHKPVEVDLLPRPQPKAQPEPEVEEQAITPVRSMVTTPDESPLLQALRCYLENRPGDALPILGRLDKENQDLLLCLLPLTAQLTEGNVRNSSPEHVAVMLEQLRSLEVPLRARSPLTVNKMSFCRRIDAFGVFEPLPADYDFRPGELVQAYVEVGNFTSKKQMLPDGGEVYVTQLASSVEIRDFEKQLVWREDFRRKHPDRSQTQRQDYFDHYSFRLPTNLPPGHYTLWIQVQDQGTQPPRMARRSLDFRVTNSVARANDDGE